MLKPYPALRLNNNVLYVLACLFIHIVLLLIDLVHLIQNGGRRRTKIRAKEVDPLFRKCDLNHILSST